jgi:hypothetical protein
MTIRSRHAVLLVLPSLLAAAPILRAQNRFEILSRDTIAQADVTIDTVRDRRTSTCYALFSATQGSSIARALGTAGTIVPRIVESGRASHEEPVDTRAPDPQSFATMPWATQTPGTPTGGWEHLAESMRRALVDPSTARALSAPLHDALISLDDRLRHIESLLQQIEEARTFAVWPVPCDVAINR